MFTSELRPGMRVEMAPDHSLTVATRPVYMWNGTVALIFHEIPETFYFDIAQIWDVIDLDWHSSSDTHSYR